MNTESRIASVIMAAGRGSRMKAYDGNKTLLPLIPGDSPFEGSQPILRHIIDTLPSAPPALIVNYKSGDVKAATQGLGLTYCHQPVLNGTGGAVLAAREFIEHQPCDRLVITMGDVPFVRPETYRNLIEKLDRHHLVVLGFEPKDKKQYGILEIAGDQVEKITEWKFWREYPAEKQAVQTVCNSGIYAARREELLRYLSVLESRPQTVLKERDGKMVEIEEYFITDIAEYMTADGLSVGYALTADEMETMGVDDPDALARAQAYYRSEIG
ncbi:MobA-like NTP transferase domain containing prot ein [Desulfonema ishimotonii]|uniref:MobA-like NTP transferase domain containing prot ein n=1 Tax=Desulfonema ishimotonii TaxID=45657 RepID=A0A401FWN0_9BACT|nr:NTP transferase domain-containing protein [Desulfonema ishimotonii]GBC61375.1 MobA-like NTP transferase domain containing prot ein [Desulfonema ishimotonii]